MRGTMQLVLIVIAAVAMLVARPAGQDARTFTGVVSDAMCELNHSSMRMGDTDAECARACHDSHDAAYVLVDDERVFNLSDQDAAGKLAGQRVRVVGRLDASTNTIRVESMAAQ